jgi:hypothetical protein
MRAPLHLVFSLALGLAAGTARAACECPKIPLEDRIAGATYIFTGRPVTTAQIPPGGSPFHSERTLEEPQPPVNDLITLFRIDTVWKGEARKMVRVRHDQGICGAHFDSDRPMIVFAQADPFGILWTQFCSGNVEQGDSSYDQLNDALAKRLKYE